MRQPPKRTPATPPSPEAPKKKLLSPKKYARFQRFKEKAKANARAAAAAGQGRAESDRDRQADGRSGEGGNSGRPAIRPPTPPVRRGVTLRPAPEVIEYREDEAVSAAGRSRSRSPEPREGKGEKGKKGKKGGKGCGKKGGK